MEKTHSGECVELSIRGFGGNEVREMAELKLQKPASEKMMTWQVRNGRKLRYVCCVCSHCGKEFWYRTDIISKRKTTLCRKCACQQNQNARRGIPRSEEVMQKMSIARKQWWNNLSNEERAEHNRKISLATKGQPHSPEHNRKVWEAVKDKLGEGFLKSQGRFKKSIGTASEAAQISNAKKWSNPETKALALRNIMKAVNAKPNLTELHLQFLLDQYFPSEWKFVGDGEVIIGGKLPDYININGKKQIIELFGTYWHDIFDVAIRIDHFRQCGFRTLVVWEDELKNEVKLIRKIKSFTRRKEHARH